MCLSGSLLLLTVRNNAEFPLFLRKETFVKMNNRYVKKNASDPELTRRIQELIQYKGGGYNEIEVVDIIENALKLLADVKNTGDVRVIQTAIRELRYSFRLFAPYART